MSFTKFNLDNKIVNALNKNNITNPTVIQQQAIPLILNNKDVLAKAPTGTGKTVAFAAPIVNKLIGNTTFNPRVLVLSPTRELSNQITSTFKYLIKPYGFEIISIIGGESIKQQSKKIENGLDIVVATPGRLVDLIKQNKINLDSIQYFVLDEADLMLDMGFIRDIKFIKQQLNKNHLQTILVSATIPKEVKELSKEFLNKNYAYIEAFHHEENKNNIVHNVCYLEKKDKPKLLIDLISKNKDKTFIVFINTKKVSNYLSRCLFEANIKAQIIHGDKSQTFREKAMTAFKNKKANVLIATDVASRGIHIDNINFVINYDVPNNSDTYTHRVGRTGRANSKGEAYTFVTENEFYYLKEIYFSNKQINVITNNLLCNNIDWDLVKKSKSSDLNINRRSKKRNDVKKEYFNDKSYETKKDLKRKKDIQEFNDRVDLNKSVKNFTWGNKQNKNSFNSKSDNKNNNSNNNFKNNKKNNKEKFTNNKNAKFSKSNNYSQNKKPNGNRFNKISNNKRKSNFSSNKKKGRR